MSSSGRMLAAYVDRKEAEIRERIERVMDGEGTWTQLAKDVEFTARQLWGERWYDCYRNMVDQIRFEREQDSEVF